MVQETFEILMDQPEPVAEGQLEVLSEQQVEEVVAGEGSQNLATFDGAEFVGAFSESFDYLIRAFPRLGLPLFPFRFGFLTGHRLIPERFVPLFLRESWLLSHR
ncbi:hypothetical protein PIB30_072928 [Stylosanthes scabra]|uniref:Uncharacterized protein n=1 Tax=Stylosanthes scabra TaxID=79078 RepID=A0ABU6WNW4_9FABA|nr:hypothetical protein [Stylosanthes scabra]